MSMDIDTGAATDTQSESPRLAKDCSTITNIDLSTDPVPSTNPSQTSADFSAFPQLTLFLQNYLQNLNMAGAYVSIPWKPAYATARTIASLTHHGLRHLELAHYEFYRRYDWTIVEPKPIAPHQYIGHHITLAPNLHGEPRNVERFVANMRLGIAQTPVPMLLLVSLPDSTLSRLSSINQILNRKAIDLGLAPQKAIRLKFQPTLRLYTSPTSQCLFLAGQLALGSDDAQFLESITELVDEIRQLNDLDWSQGESAFTGTYHVTLAKSSEPVVLSKQQVSVEQELELINEELATMEIPGLDEIEVDVECVEVAHTLATGVKTESVAFT